MCGRFTITTSPEELNKRFGLPAGTVRFEARYNLAPGQQAPVISAEGGRRMSLMRWGFIPHWAASQNTGYHTINARCESIGSKPMFRDSVRHRRCLIPADGFYEWVQASDSSHKIPYRFVRKDRGLFAFAGLWDSWQHPMAQEPLMTFTIVTTPASAFVQAYHDRMPAILTPEEEETWLEDYSTPVDEVVKLLKPYSSDDLEAYRVSNAVNKASHDAPDCIEEML